MLKKLLLLSMSVAICSIALGCGGPTMSPEQEAKNVQDAKSAIEKAKANKAKQR